VKFCEKAIAAKLSSDAPGSDNVDRENNIQYDDAKWDLTPKAARLHDTSLWFPIAKCTQQARQMAKILYRKITIINN
jgi:hypothetical protein